MEVIISFQNAQKYFTVLLYVNILIMTTDDLLVRYVSTCHASTIHDQNLNVFYSTI
jgi:hypothetical protein